MNENEAATMTDEEQIRHTTKTFLATARKEKSETAWLRFLEAQIKKFDEEIVASNSVYADEMDAIVEAERAAVASINRDVTDRVGPVVEQYKAQEQSAKDRRDGLVAAAQKEYDAAVSGIRKEKKAALDVFEKELAQRIEAAQHAAEHERGAPTRRRRDRNSKLVTTRSCFVDELQSARAAAAKKKPPEPKSKPEAAAS